jgi:ribosomal protein L40E
MAPEYVCDRCGEVNPIGTVFCVNCHAYLDLAPRLGEPAVLSLRIRNTSVWLGCC